MYLFHFHHFLYATWPDGELRGQKEILVKTLCLEFLQTAPGKEVLPSSEESLFSWDFLPSFSSACPNNSDNLQLNSRRLHVDWNQAVSEAYPDSNTYSLWKYNQNADRGYPKAGPTSWWTEASFPAWPSVPGLEPSPFLPSIIHGVPCLSLIRCLLLTKFTRISLFLGGAHHFLDTRFLTLNPAFAVALVWPMELRVIII